MKKPSDNIYQLIHSMTPAEKRYFKWNFSSSKGVLVNIFDQINKSREYDEKQIKAKIGPSAAKNYKVLKVQLQDLILRSLVASSHKKRLTSIIRSGLDEVEVLIEKQLLDFANARLGKVKEICLKYEEFTYLIEVTYLQYYLDHIRQEKHYLQNQKIFDDLRKYIGYISQRMNFLNQSTDIHEYIRKTRKNDIPAQEKTNLIELLDNNFFVGADEEIPFRNQLSLNILKTVVHLALHNKQEEERSREKNVALFNQNPHFKKSLPFLYLGVLRNYANYCCDHQLFSLARNTILEAEEFVEKNKTWKVQLIHFYYLSLKINFLQNDLVSNTGAFEKTVLKLLKSYRIEKERIAILCYLILFISHLGKGAHRNAQNYIRKMRQCDYGIELFLEKLIDIMELINHMDCEDFTSVSRLLKSIYRRNDRKTEKQGGFYQDFLEMIKAMEKNPLQKPELARVFKQKLANYKEEKLYNIFRTHRLDIWLDAVENKSALSKELESLSSLSL